MANNKEKDEDVKIPIEDAADEKATEQAAEVEEAEQTETESVDEVNEAEEADEEETEFEGEEDLIAEAEAIVEEASAADKLEDAFAKASEWKDRYMRLHAEWDTYRRRTNEQRAEEKTRATQKLMENLLPVLDDFERTVAYAEENGETGLLDGVKAVQAKLLDRLGMSGLEIIDPAGEPYDALAAQAVGTVPDEEAYDETVRDVYQKGYRMGRKVLRPAMVTITTGGPARPKEETEADDE